MPTVSSLWSKCATVFFVRASSQTMRRHSGLPVLRLHATALSRWFVIPAGVRREMADARCEMEGGGCEMEGGGCEMEGGGWQMRAREERVRHGCRPWAASRSLDREVMEDAPMTFTLSLAQPAASRALQASLMQTSQLSTSSSGSCSCHLHRRA